MSQQPPVKNGYPHVADQVIKEIYLRKKLGTHNYGCALQPFNGRNALQDAYEESIDQSLYLKQALIEREEMISLLHAMANAKTQDTFTLFVQARDLLEKLGEL